MAFRFKRSTIVATVLLAFVAVCQPSLSGNAFAAQALPYCISHIPAYAPVLGPDAFSAVPLANTSMADGDRIDPAGLAYDQKGTLYAVDRDGARILRVSPGGTITIAAGPSQGAGRQPGYVDGPAAAARFNSPVGVAVGQRGAVYVADSGNRVVRVLSADGEVRTVAGSTRAHFKKPSGIAIDSGGTLYVADPDSGVWSIDQAGSVAKIRVPVQAPFAIATAGEAPFTTLFVSGRDGIAFVPLGPGKAASWFPTTYQEGPSVLQLEGFRPIGTPGALTALNGHSVLYVDPSANVVRYLDVPMHIGRIVAGSRAALESPTGIAVAPDGLVAVSTKNHGIILLSRLDLREPIIPAAGASIPSGLDELAYRIALVGNSFVWWNTDWPDSIAGLLQNALARARIPGQAQVYPIVLPDGTVQSAEGYIGTLGDLGLIRMAILQVNASMIARSFNVSRDAVVDPVAPWRAAFTEGVVALKRTLDAHRIPLIVVAQPEESEPSDPQGRTLETFFLSQIKPLGVNVADLYPPFALAVRSQHLFGVCDKHFERAGRQLTADALAQYVIHMFAAGR